MKLRKSKGKKGKGSKKLLCSSSETRRACLTTKNTMSHEHYIDKLILKQEKLTICYLCLFSSADWLLLIFCSSYMAKLIGKVGIHFSVRYLRLFLMGLKPHLKTVIYDCDCADDYWILVPIGSQTEIKTIRT